MVFRGLDRYRERRLDGRRVLAIKPAKGYEQIIVIQYEDYVVWPSKIGLPLLRYIHGDDHSWLSPSVLNPVFRVLVLDPRVPRTNLVRATITMINKLPFQHVNDSGPIFVAMDSKEAARFKLYHPHPELATL